MIFIDALSWSSIGESLIKGILLALILYVSKLVWSHLTKKRTRLVCVQRTINVTSYLSEWIKDLEISYKGLSISSFSVSQIGVWNDGRQQIDGDGEKIKISIKNNYKIISADIVYQRKDYILCKTTISSNMQSAEIEFSHLNFQDSFVIQIFHNCPYDNPISLSVLTKKLPSIKQRNYRKASDRGTWRYLAGLILLFSVPAIFVIYFCSTIESIFGKIAYLIGTLFLLWVMLFPQFNSLPYGNSAFKKIRLRSKNN